jgi:hypothetical protein
MKSGTKNVLVFGNRNRKVEEVERILAEHSHRICVLSQLSDRDTRLLNDDVDVIVVTDSMGHEPNREFFSHLRILFPYAKMLCLFDRITEQMERAMRGKGLVFLGSYNHFRRYYQDILRTAMTNSESRKRL